MALNENEKQHMLILVPRGDVLKKKNDLVLVTYVRNLCKSPTRHKAQGG